MIKGAKRGRFWVVLAMIALGVHLITSNVVSVVQVEGYSMAPTFESGEYKLMNRLDKDVEFGDIVVFRMKDRYLVKRVIGVGGDRVEIKEGRLLLNGEVKDEPWFRGIMSKDMEEVVIKEGTLFVMGDNRENSLDSRSEVVGLVSINELLGTIIFP